MEIVAAGLGIIALIFAVLWLVALVCLADEKKRHKETSEERNYHRKSSEDSAQYARGIFSENQRLKNFIAGREFK